MNSKTSLPGQNTRGFAASPEAIFDAWINPTLPPWGKARWSLGIRVHPRGL